MAVVAFEFLGWPPAWATQPALAARVVCDGSAETQRGGRLACPWFLLRGMQLRGRSARAAASAGAPAAPPASVNALARCPGTSTKATPTVWDLSGLQVVMSIRYLDRVQPDTPWEVVLYVDHAADDDQRTAAADIFLGRAGGTVAHLYGPAIGEVHAMRSARITLEHAVPRKRIGVVGYLTVEAEGDASAPGDVRCAGSPVLDHPARSSTVTGSVNRPGPALGSSRMILRRLRH